MPARFTDAGADLMMKQIAQEQNPFRMDGVQAYMHYDAISIQVTKDRGTLVTFHWQRKAIYTMTADSLINDTLTLTGLEGRMGVHISN